jgi:sortase A
LKIPKLGVEKAVVQGVTLGLLKRGPGHYPSTPMPGQPGNAAIAGHRTTYGAPFFRLNELNLGDPILVTTAQGRFRYEVSEKRVVSPDETSVLRPSTDNRLTLTTCNPRFSAAQRLIVVALLKGEAAELPPTPATTVAPTVPTTAAGSAPTTATSTTSTTRAPSLAELEEAEETEETGLSGRNAANGPAVAWGMAAAAVWLLTWLVARRWRKWPAYLLGTPVFLVVLFMFFENFSRLLPSNY